MVFLADAKIAVHIAVAAGVWTANSCAIIASCKLVTNKRHIKQLCIYRIAVACIFSTETAWPAKAVAIGSANHTDFTMQGHNVTQYIGSLVGEYGSFRSHALVATGQFA